MLGSSKRTLKSLAQLLSEITRIVISDKVANKINLTLNSVQKAEVSMAEGGERMHWLMPSWRLKIKVHPSLLALLYFPDDPKYAIYIPLFMPVMIPVIMSLTQIQKKKRGKKQKTE